MLSVGGGQRGDGVVNSELGSRSRVNVWMSVSKKEPGSGAKE